MNTINDLNSPGNVTYNQQSSYAIVYGSSAGNATVNTDKYYYHTVQKQVPLTSITSAVRDVLIDWSFTNTPVANVAYTGPWSNIGVQQVAPQTWRMYGVRDVARYNEAFANTVVWDNGTANSYTYTTLAQDQLGNNRSWSTAVNVRAAPTLSVSGPVIYDEDTQEPITIVSVSGNANTTASYTLTTTIPNILNGNIANTTTSGATVDLVGNIVSLNAQISTGNIVFNPARDFTSNVANQFGFALKAGTTTVSTASANLEIGNAHSEYSLTTSYTYSTNGEILMVFDILDLDPNVQNFTVTFDQTVGNTGIFLLNSVSQGLGNVVTITDSRANINAANVTFVPYPSTSGSVGITYSQSKLTTDGNVIVQANAVPIVATCPSPVSAYTLDTTYTTTQNERTVLDFTIPETDARTTDYTFTVVQTSPDPALTPGLFQSYIYPGFLPPFTTNIGGNTAVFTDSKNNINSYWGNVSYVNSFNGNVAGSGLNYWMPSDQTANVTLAFSLVKNNSLFGNVTIANAVPITMSVGTTFGTWSLPSGNTFSVNQDSAVLLPILVDNRDRYNLLDTGTGSEQPWGGEYRYWLNNITPSGNNLQGRFYRFGGTDIGNITSVTPINPRDWTVGATDYTQDTSNGVQWYEPSVNQFYLPSSESSPGLIYYPPPGYVGNVALSVDITKSRYVNGAVANVQVGNTIALTVTSNSTSPTLYTGPANTSIATGNTHYLLANVSDPVGRNILTSGGVPNPDWANGTYHGLYATTVSIPDTSLGNLFIGAAPGTPVNLGNTYTIANANSGDLNNRYFSGNTAGQSPYVLSFKSNGSTGNVVLSTTVTRIHPDSPNTVIGTSSSTITIT